MNIPGGTSNSAPPWDLKFAGMNYKETLDYFYAQLPMFDRIGAAAYKKGLNNTQALCAHLGNPQTRFQSIHVAGTNGKGSVSHILAAVCQAAGLKTGLYVSPHYKDLRERIKINGEYIPRGRVVDFVEANLGIIESVRPSFFEMCVAMAFDHFAREKVDIAIIETGLGGRVDSTNIITPLLSVITNISFDHTKFLGDTLPLIAMEKSGIIKPGVPVVIGESHPESAPVFRQKAAEMSAPIYFADQNYQLTDQTNTFLSAQTRYQVYKQGQLLWENLEVDASGPFQALNVATALQAVEVFEKIAGAPRIRDPESSIRYGLSHLRTLTRFQGRWQIIGEQPTILCDSAHNEAGIRTAFERISDLRSFNKPAAGVLATDLSKERSPDLHIVAGFVTDKDVDKMLDYFPPEARYYFAKANIPRGMDTKALRERAAAAGLHGKAYSSVKNALKAAKRAADPDDLILVIGSIFVVAEVL